MLQQHIQKIISNQQVHTSSILQIQPPEQYKNANYSFQWLSQNICPGIYRNILTRFDVSKMNKSNQFQCTPLDFGNFIIGRVLLNKQNDNRVIKQVKFGPVAAQNGIEIYKSKSSFSEVKIVFSKNVILNGSIKIISGPIADKNNYKINIAIEGQQFKFIINIDQNIRLPSNNSFFKFYEKELDSLGISVYHQHSQFVQKLKNIKNTVNFGFYIKVNFNNKFQRDGFLFQLLQNFGTDLNSLRNTTTEEPKITIKQTCMMKSGSSLNKRQVQHAKSNQVDDQIYKLLYQRSQMHNQSSLDMVDAQLLFSSKRFDQKNENFLVSPQNQLIDDKQQPSQKLVYKVKKLQNQISNILNEKSEQQYIVANFYNNTLQNQTQKTEPGQNFLRDTITKLTHQIKTLLKQNRKLAQENKKLKDQNMRLRFKQIKNFPLKVTQDPINRNKSTQMLLQQKQRSASKNISPQKAGHEKKISFLNPIQQKQKMDETKLNQEKSRQKINDYKVVEQKQRNPQNIDRSKSKSKIIKKKSITNNFSSVASLNPLSSINSSKYSEKQMLSTLINTTVNNKDLIKQKQINPQYLKQNELIQQRKSYGFQRRPTPQIPCMSQSPTISKYTTITSSLKSNVVFKK